MRRYLIGCLAVVGTLSLLVMLGIAGAVVSLVRHIPHPVKTEAAFEAGVLTVDLNGTPAEGRGDDPLGALLSGGTVRLRDIVDGLDAAALDTRIKGLVVSLSTAHPSLAQAQEIGAAVKRFRAAGKTAFAVADTLDEGASSAQLLVLASSFDKIWLQPSGSLGSSGLRLERPYAADGLKMLGVVPRFGQRKEFKGGIDGFTEMSIAAPLRQSLQGLLDDLYTQVVASVAAGRGLSVDATTAALARTPMAADDAVRAKLIDGIGYDVEIAAQLGKTVGTSTLIALEDYLAKAARPNRAGERVALIYGVGMVVRNDPQGDFTGSRNMAADTIVTAFQQAADDPKVRVIVFRIDSPGGSYVASDTIWQAVHRARAAGKKVVASLGTLAASGGYFSAIPCDLIVAQPGTLTGSIGVYSGKFVLTGLWQKLGIAWDGVEAGRHAGMMSSNQDFSAEEWTLFQRDLDRVYADFTGRVAKDRNIPADRIEQVAGGRIWTGAQAKSLGLVDELGDFNTALAAARKLAGLEPDAAIELVAFPRADDPFATALHALKRLGPMAAQMSTLDRVTSALAPLSTLLPSAETDQRLMMPLGAGGLR